MSDARNPSKNDDIGCLEAIEALYAWLDNEMDDPDSIARVEHHLHHCHSCYSRTEMERALTAHIRQSSKTPTPDALKKRLKALIDGF